MAKPQVRIRVYTKKIDGLFNYYKKYFSEEVQSVLFDKLVDIVIPALQGRLVENKSVFTGKLASTMKAKRVSTQILTIDFGVPYAGNVEYGIGPQADVDFEKILAWVKVKNKLDGLEAVKVARVIAKVLRKKGAEPHPFIQPTLDFIVEEAIWQLERVVKAKIKNLE